MEVEDKHSFLAYKSQYQVIYQMFQHLSVPAKQMKIKRQKRGLCTYFYDLIYIFSKAVHMLADKAYN